MLSMVCSSDVLREQQLLVMRLRTSTAKERVVTGALCFQATRKAPCSVNVVLGILLSGNSDYQDD